MDYNLLKIFTTVAKYKSISQASNELGFAQSNVTSRIKQLEKKLESLLFHRVPKGMLLTKKGKIFLPHAIEILNKTKTAVNILKDNKYENLIIGSTQSNAIIRIIEFLKFFNEDNKHINVELLTAPTLKMREKLLSYEVDIAFISGGVNDNRLFLINEIYEEMVLVEPKHKTYKQAFLYFNDSCLYKIFAQEYFNTINEKIPSYKFGNFEIILGCVELGMGKTILPLSLIKKLKYENSLKITSLPDKIKSLPTSLVCRKDNIPSCIKYLKQFNFDLKSSKFQIA